MSKVKFFYANGTAYLLNVLQLGFSISNIFQVHVDFPAIVNAFGIPDIDRYLKPANRTIVTIPGLNGRTVVTDLQPQNDPFPSLLDPDIFDVVRVGYAASTLDIGNSILAGKGYVMDAINALNPGTPFALGGYSQGAAVMSSVYKEIQSGSLTSRAADLVGGVMFGNPRREVNFRGEVGGTWSGAWDVPGSTTGGHGSFPGSGAFSRLSGSDGTKWIEFAAPDDIITSTGDSTNGANWVDGNNVLLSLAGSVYAGTFLSGVLAAAVGITTPMLAGINAAKTIGGEVNHFTDIAGNTLSVPGGGHVTYPVLPPVNSDGTPGSGDTSYQIALKWLEGKASEWATAPIMAPATLAGWSNTLILPTP